MKALLTIGCMVAVMVCAVAQAQESTVSGAVTCQKGDLSRTIEVTYAGQQGEPPCEVHYRKTVEQPGHDEVLWTSEHTKDYCETKMQEFVEKLRSWGWTCQ
jgi:hypothetical protein